MSEEKAEGIVLRTLDFKDRQRIITVFTQEAGVVSLVVKGLSKRNYRLLALSTPFCHADFIYSKGRSDLFRFVDGTILDEHLDLRQRLSSVQAAGTLTQILLQSQLPGKDSPALYALFRSYLKQIASFQDPSTLVASFKLKMLKHEGLLALSQECSFCSDYPPRYLLDGQSVCQKHREGQALAFSKEEWDLLHLLESAQQFSALREVRLSPAFFKSLTTYFQQRIQH